MQLKNTLLAGAAILALASCGQNKGGSKTADTGSRNLLDRANMDTTVSPGDNFNLYANGTWLKNNPIPKSKTRWGSFNELQENNYNALHSLLDSAAGTTNAKPGSNVQKVGDFYRSGMDSAMIDKIGITSLSDIITRINNVREVNDLVNEIAVEH